MSESLSEENVKLTSRVEALSKIQPAYFAEQNDRADRAVAEFVNGYRNRALPLALKRESNGTYWLNGRKFYVAFD